MSTTTGTTATGTTTTGTRTTYSVGADEPARTTGRIDAILASFPVSLAPAHPPEDADLVALDGGEDWPKRLATTRARGAVVVCPTVSSTVVPTSAGQGADPGFPVVIDRPHAGRPGLADLRSAVQATGADALLEVRTTAAPGNDAADLVLEQFAVARAVTGSGVAAARVLSHGPRGLLVRAVLHDGRQALFGADLTTALAPLVTVRILGATSSVSVAIPDSATARPAHAVVTDDSGARLLPTSWESSHRASWRRLHAAVADGTATTDLADHAQDCAVLVEAIPELLPPTSSPNEPGAQR
ncbi:hypothetical protein [Kineococcus sp. SYSU DK003]|uniref:hypothetical protein n=1 Tax=Kineococcus sp. SYSU DK003 TaxID=3383124 RepID=UPI003D7D0B4A